MKTYHSRMLFLDRFVYLLFMLLLLQGCQCVYIFPAAGLHKEFPITESGTQQDFFQELPEAQYTDASSEDISPEEWQDSPQDARCQAGSLSPCKTGKQGICADGMKFCQNGRWTYCSPQQIPQKESCDNKDNDCDGQIDEGLVCPEGCADGQREGFLDHKTYPDIAGCSGGWSIPGIHTHHPGKAPACPNIKTYPTTKTHCQRRAGDDSQNPQGKGCSVEDLCAAGWHVCKGAADLKASSPTGCKGVTTSSSPSLFFASRQSSTGCAACTTGTSTQSKCNSTSCKSGCQQTAKTSNDVFGCGNFGDIVQHNACKPFDRFSGNNCLSIAQGGWSCPASQGLCEAYTLVKKSSAFGGVLCCRNSP